MLNLVLVAATVAGICSCQTCIIPTNEDLQDVIEEIFRAEDASSTPTVTVIRFHPVCLALDDVQDRYRAVSVLVEYTCTGNPSCPSGTVVEQIESQCDNGEWSNVVLGSTEFTRSQTTEASFSTSTREVCLFCVSPELEPFIAYITDSVTHCVGEYMSLDTSTLHRQLPLLCVFPQPVTHLVSWDVLIILLIAVTTTITPCVWMNAPVLSSQTLPMSVYVHLGLLDSTVLRVSQTLSVVVIKL